MASSVIAIPIIQPLSKLVENVPRSIAFAILALIAGLIGLGLKKFQAR